MFGYSIAFAKSWSTWCVGFMPINAMSPSGTTHDGFIIYLLCFSFIFIRMHPNGLITRD